MAKQKKPETITMRALRQRLRDCIERAERGERFVVTAYGNVKCQVGPVEVQK